MKFKILQLRDEHAEGRIFRSLEHNGPIDLGHYKAVYEGDVTDSGKDRTMLANLFLIFNRNHPDDFRGHSMSASDIVMLDDSRLWYCDPYGWVELKGENAPVKESRVTLDVGTPAPRKTCQWFLKCTNPATTALPHPTLGSVPTCLRCATKVARLKAAAQAGGGR